MQRRICRFASSRYGSRVEVVSPKSETFRVSLAASTVFYTSAGCGWRRGECGGMI